MIKNHYNYHYLLSVLFLLIYCSLSAQTIITSPYSRYGVGDLSANANAWNLAMGGTSIGLRSPYHVNINNPASYTAFDSTSFLFEGGAYFNYSQLQYQYSDNHTYLCIAWLPDIRLSCYQVVENIAGAASFQ